MRIVRETFRSADRSSGRSHVGSAESYLQLIAEQCGVDHGKISIYDNFNVVRVCDKI